MDTPGILIFTKKYFPFVKGNNIMFIRRIQSFRTRKKLVIFKQKNTKIVV